MVRLNWTDEAKYCLKNIHDYIALDNPQVAKNVVKKIREKAQILKSFPESGGQYQNLERKDVRVIYYTHYRIAYLIVDAQRIDIIGVFHGAMELKKYIK
ncbi:MAG: type II toxin-antitoxin system RelE/ParE family toxin [Candidatus Kuenenia sp.]|nr:type II toxin-antitoxin system RelE/ParE family toxin [Candidatus Kuenenia hertensis]